MSSISSVPSNGQFLIDLDDLRILDCGGSRKESCTSIGGSSQLGFCLLDDQESSGFDDTLLDKSQKNTVTVGNAHLPLQEIPSAAPRSDIAQEYEKQEQEYLQIAIKIKEFFIGTRSKTIEPQKVRAKTDKINDWHAWASKDDQQSSPTTNFQGHAHFTVAGGYRKNNSVPVPHRRGNSRTGSSKSRGKSAGYDYPANSQAVETNNWTPRGLQIAEDRKHSTFQYKYNKALHARMNVNYDTLAQNEVAGDLIDFST